MKMNLLRGSHTNPNQLEPRRCVALRSVRLFGLGEPKQTAVRTRPTWLNSHANASAMSSLVKIRLRHSVATKTVQLMRHGRARQRSAPSLVNQSPPLFLNGKVSDSESNRSSWIRDGILSCEETDVAGLSSSSRSSDLICFNHSLRFR